MLKMNFVIFSYNFPPGNDAEAFCTARFASALVHCGHNVHVVTMDRVAKIDKYIYDQVVDARITITRVPDKNRRLPLFSRLRFVTNSAGAENFSECIKAVKNALRKYDNPILISRANPNSSMIIGWYCRKFASVWIAHASDPIPIPGRDTNPLSRYRFEYRYWMKKALKDADYVSVTCDNAIRAFKEEYGCLTRDVKFIVTPHIGHPPLKIKDPGCERSCRLGMEEKLIVHKGVLCNGRGGPELADAVRMLNREGKRCAFVQVGPLENETDLFDKDRLVRRSKYADADVLYVPDLQVPLPFCPFLSSKIVYMIYTDKPILLFSHVDGASAELARKYPEAGIFFADFTKPETLINALRSALNCTNCEIDRSRIRMEFMREKIVRNFVKAIGGK